MSSPRQAIFGTGAIGLASDYLGPRGGAQSMLGETAPSWATPTSPTPTPTSPTSAKAWPSWANTPTPTASLAPPQRPPDPDHPPLDQALADILATYRTKPS
jgi:hypothetical protein